MTDYYWPPEARTKHLYMPGMSGYGKTSLMAHLALDDIEYEDGPVIVIDPKGSKQGLIERILPRIPKGLIESTFYVSLKHPVPIDLLGYKESPDNFEKNLVRSDIIGILKRFSMGNWGTTMQDMLNNLVPTLLEAPETTFLDIGRFLESPKERDRILERVSQSRRDYWKHNPPTNQDRGPLMARMSNFKEPPLKTIVDGKRGEGLSIAEIIENNQILLLDTSPKSEDGMMLGALIMSRIQQAIFRRSPDKEHPMCHVYADEFHNFVTSALSEMLLESRSFNLSVCMANPSPVDLKDIWHHIKAAVSSYVIFKMDGEDATLFKGKLHDPSFDTSDYDRQLRERNERIQWLKETVAVRQKLADDAWNTQGATIGDMDSWNLNVEAARDELRGLINSPLAEPKAPLSFLKQIPNLQIGEVIYVAHDGTTRKLNTPKFPDPPTHSYVNDIKKATLARYAEKLTKRSVDKPPSHDTKNVVELGEDVPARDGNEEVPKTLLPDESKKSRSPKPR
jgi:hypothetical protein